MSSAIRNFIVMFCLFLIFFGICGHYFATTLVPDLISARDSDTGNSDADDREQSVDENNGIIGDDNLSNTEDDTEYDTFTMAFFCLGLEEELVEIYMVHVNDGYKTCVSASIPASSTAEIGGFSLMEIYKKNGVDYLVKKLQYLTGYTIDDYATLLAVDRNGKGHSVTDLSKRFGYHYRLNEAFEYPDPLYVIYKDKLENGEIEEEEISEESGDAVTDNDAPNEYFTVEADNYDLLAITNGLKNYVILLDSKYNPNAHVIFEEFLKRMLENDELKKNLDKQASVMKCFEDKTFSDIEYKDTKVAKYLFKYENQQTAFKCEKISDWDNIKNTLKAKEKGNVE